MPDQTMEQVGPLHRRRITLHDGRYLIFYTFGADLKSPSQDKTDARPQPEPEPRATEESGV
jgi:hypothetical protein